MGKDRILCGLLPLLSVPASTSYLMTPTFIWILAGVLLLIYAAYVMKIRWAEKRCKRHGHRWQLTQTGMCCKRCKHAIITIGVD